MLFLLDVEDDPLWHGADNDQYEEEGSGDRWDGRGCISVEARSGWPIPSGFLTPMVGMRLD